MPERFDLIGLLKQTLDGSIITVKELILREKTAVKV